MMLLDSHKVKSPSWITGIIALGFNARNSALSVALKPEPQSSRSNATSNSAQAHRTFRTLMEEALPSIRSMVFVLMWGRLIVRHCQVPVKGLIGSRATSSWGSCSPFPKVPLSTLLVIVMGKAAP